MLQEIVTKKTVKPAQQRDRTGYLTATYQISARRASRFFDQQADVLLQVDLERSQRSSCCAH